MPAEPVAVIKVMQVALRLTSVASLAAMLTACAIAASARAPTARVSVAAAGVVGGNSLEGAIRKRR